VPDQARRRERQHQRLHHQVDQELSLRVHRDLAKKHVAKKRRDNFKVARAYLNGAGCIGILDLRMSGPRSLHLTPAPALVEH